MAEADQILLLAGELRLRGGTLYTLQMAKRLPEHAFKPKVLAENLQYLSRDYLRELPLREVTHLTTFGLNRLVLGLLLAEFKEDPPDLIHVQTRQMIKPGTWLAERLNCPLIVTVHDYLKEKERLRLPQQIPYHVITVSESLRNDLLQRTKLPEERVTVISTGVVCPEQSACPQVLAAGNAPVFGTAGALEEVKGVHFFLGAAQRVLRAIPEAHFLIAGTGPEEDRLYALSRELGISKRVTFLSSPHDFSPSLSAMDVYCLPSLKQGLGTIMLQAMARGRPVIATKTGGVFSVIRDRETGLVVPPGNPDVLADRMIELVRHPELARELGAAGRELVQREYDVQTMVAKTVELYKQLLTKRPSNDSNQMDAVTGRAS